MFAERKVEIVGGKGEFRGVDEGDEEEKSWITVEFKEIRKAEIVKQY